MTPLMFTDEEWNRASMFAVHNVECPFSICKAPIGQECRGKHKSHAARTIAAAKVLARRDADKKGDE